MTGCAALPIGELRTDLRAHGAAREIDGAAVLLLGMRIPPNYGPRYTDEFWRSYGELARRAKLPLVPFLLQGIALIPGSMQADGLHPNESGAATRACERVAGIEAAIVQIMRCK